MKTKDKTYIISAFFIVTYLVIVLFLVFPVYGEIKSDNVNLVSQKNSIFSLQNQVNELKKFNQEKINYQVTFDKADQILVDSNNPVDFIKFLEKTAKDSGIILDITVLPQEDSKTSNDLWKPISFQIVSSGEFSGTLNLISKLENAPYLISIQNLKISKKQPVLVAKKNIQQTSAIEAECVIKVFGK